MTARSAGVDAVRIIGMLAIVAGHIWLSPWSKIALYSWHVPLFFLLSGYLMKPGKSVRREVGDRARTLLLPYVIWLVVIAAVAAFLGLFDENFTSVKALLDVWGGEWQSTPFWAFWFVTALFFATVLHRATQRFPLGVQWIVAVVLMLTAFLPGRPLHYLPLAIGSALVALLYLVAGSTLSMVRSRIPRPGALGAAAMATGFLIAVATGGFVDVRLLRLGTPVVSVAASLLIAGGLVLVCDAVFERVSSSVSSAVTRTALASLVVLFIHVPILLLLERQGLGELPVFLVTVGCSWALGLALLVLPHTWPLTGVLPRRRSSAVLGRPTIRLSPTRTDRGEPAVRKFADRDR